MSILPEFERNSLCAAVLPCLHLEMGSCICKTILRVLARSIDIKGEGLGLDHVNKLYPNEQ